MLRNSFRKASQEYSVFTRYFTSSEDLPEGAKHLWESYFNRVNKKQEKPRLGHADYDAEQDYGEQQIAEGLREEMGQQGEQVMEIDWIKCTQ